MRARSLFLFLILSLLVTTINSVGPLPSILKPVVTAYLAGGDQTTNAIANYGTIEEWDTSEVTDMNDCFNGKQTFNADISKWQTSSVTTMIGLFNNAKVFNADLSKVSFFFFDLILCIFIFIWFLLLLFIVVHLCPQHKIFVPTAFLLSTTWTLSNIFVLFSHYVLFQFFFYSGNLRK
jgi:surface protein